MHGHDHGRMLVQEHLSTLWPHYANIVLGLWLVTSPFAMGYLSEFAPDANQLRVMQERGLPSFELRNLAMAWSDVVSGGLIVLFGVLAASPSRRFPWAQWAAATVGFWLLFAPLVFWTPLPEAYANDTVVGALVIAFAVLIPMMPGMSMEGMMGGSSRCRYRAGRCETPTPAGTATFADATRRAPRHRARARRSYRA